MSFEALQERLTALQETQTQLQELIERLASLKFQPGSVPLSADEDDNVGSELSAEISQILKEESEDVGVLQEEITDLRPGRPGSDVEHTRTRLQDGVKRLEEELRSSRVAFRKAQLAAHSNLLAAQRQERALLLQSYAAAPPSRSGAATPSLDGNGSAHSIEQAEGGDPRERLFPAGYVPPAKRRHHRRNRTGDSSNAHDGDGNIIGAASDVTTALRRTHDLMAAEMSKSTFAHETLAQSTAALQQLSESYGSLDSLLAGSRDLLGTLLKSQKSDTWYLETALALLLGTLGWLIFRRWLYGPLWWLVYFPLRTVFGVTFWAGKSAVGVARSGGGGTGASMEVAGAQGEGTKVVGMSGGAVPTVDVGQAKTEEHIEHDPDSMVGKVGKIIDGEAPDGESGTSTSEVGGQSRDDVPRNPKKRMWEEDKEAAKQGQRAKDEL